MNREIIGCGITMVFAMRAERHGPPCLLFVRVDKSCARVSPTARRPVETYPDCAAVVDLLASAATANVPWMQLRAGADRSQLRS